MATKIKPEKSLVVYHAERDFYAVKTPKPGMRTPLYDRLVESGHEIIAEVARVPGMAALQRMSDDCIAKATDGCKVEPDGKCQHGKPSWMLVMGVI